MSLFMSEFKPHLHQGQPVYGAGARLEQANAAMILLHGRGSSAHDILGLGVELDTPGFAYLAPQAADESWYPQRFIVPLASNEPYLGSALAAVNDLVQHVIEAGIPAQKIALAGFSQGACLALEFAARHPRRYGGVIAFSGGLIGPLGMKFAYPGSLDGTPVYIGCGDHDLHIPVARVKESAAALQGMGAVVQAVIFPGMGHTIHRDELESARQILAGVVTA